MNHFNGLFLKEQMVNGGLLYLKFSIPTDGLKLPRMNIHKRMDRLFQ
jgi:hypothetical protein